MELILYREKVVEYHTMCDKSFLKLTWIEGEVIWDQHEFALRSAWKKMKWNYLSAKNLLLGWRATVSLN